MALSVVSINVNGIRAAARKGLLGWIETNSPDVITLQEVRAPDEVLREILSDGWNIVHNECATKGRAGVAIASKPGINADVVAMPDLPDHCDGSGRWVEARIDTGGPAPLTVVSAYVHTGDSADDRRMKEKLAFMDRMVERVTELRDSGSMVLLTGDLNVAHREFDIRNWRGNIGRAGFREDERARLDHLFDAAGFVDLGRHFAGEVDGPYTWWTYRGRAYENDAGWRIDYQIADANLAATAKQVRVDRSMPYEGRWSDHSPLTVDFDL